MPSYQYPFPFVPDSLIVTVGGTVQPTSVEDPDAGTFELADDPLDMVVRSYARVAEDYEADDTADPDPNETAEVTEDDEGNEEEIVDEGDDDVEIPDDGGD